MKLSRKQLIERRAKELLEVRKKYDDQLKRARSAKQVQIVERRRRKATEKILAKYKKKGIEIKIRRWKKKTSKAPPPIKSKLPISNIGIQGGTTISLIDLGQLDPLELPFEGTKHEFGPGSIRVLGIFGDESPETVWDLDKPLYTKAGDVDVITTRWYASENLGSALEQMRAMTENWGEAQFLIVWKP